MAGWNDGGQCDKLIDRTSGMGYSALSLSGFGYSSDGGQTWTDGGVLEPPPGGHLFGDPVTAAGPDGTFYYATLMLDPISRIGVARSTDGGKTWSPAVDASVHAGADRDPDYFQDKPWIASDTTGSPYRGNLYVAWTEFLTTSTNNSDHSVFFARSVDGGVTFKEPLKLSVPVTRGNVTQEFPGVGTQIAVGPRGEVYVAWNDLVTRGRIWFTRSLDGGITFSPPEMIGQTLPIGDPQLCFPGGTVREVINGDIRVRSWLSMTVDVSGSNDPASPEYNPFRGRVYLAAPHAAEEFDNEFVRGDESDIAFLYSTDGGITWQNVEDTHERWVELIVNDDGTETDQFHPQVSVDSRGRVAVSWYDRRISAPDNWEMAVFAAVSIDGGETFGGNFQVSDQAFPPSRTNPNTNWLGGCYMGEYNGMTGGDGEFLLAWGDNRDGPPGHPDPNVYFDRITLDEMPMAGPEDEGTKAKPGRSGKGKGKLKDRRAAT